MKAQKLQDAPVGIIGGFQAPELESDEFRDPQFATFQRFKPASKFGQVLWFYRATDFETGDLGIELDGTRVIAVVE